MPAGIIVPTFPQRSPPRLLTAAACGGLGSVPDRRTRRAILHLSNSCASPCGPAMLVTHDPLLTCCLRALRCALWEGAHDFPNSGPCGSRARHDRCADGIGEGEGGDQMAG